ncbi:SGNH/GDSL hydrolase family protein [Microlunatus speluncae]|uniref:SGNH/GDSL hydrolase family protein n=1 Tax=Microlunatus speluncae TaxID=2594267 RepID=UPI0012665BE4|nr:SGNH/GDSL hydrolase family protein [Microlunatus speluncae]
MARFAAVLASLRRFHGPALLRNLARIGRRSPRVAVATLAFSVILFGAIPTAQAFGLAVDDVPVEGLNGQRAGWVGSWMTAVDRAGRSEPAASGFTDQTLRQVVDLSLGGDRIRVRLSNVFGDRDLRIGAATVALRRGAAGAGTAGQPLRLTFHGATATTIPVGAEALSDPVALPVPDGSHLVISLYLPVPTGRATWHRHGWATSYRAAGDASADARSGRFTAIGPSFYFLAGVDVLTRSAGAVVAFGDSITEGCCEAGSIDADASYPDRLAARLRDRFPDRPAVLNAGISGNALLSDGAGLSALTRFDRDVLGQTGVRTVIILEGINDIIHSRGAVRPEQLIRAQAELVRRARARGLRVVGATLTPFGGSGGFTAAGEQDRRTVNRWIRSSGVFDAVIDFDRLLRDPNDPARLRAAFDPGDHLHPTAAGYAAMAAALDLPIMIKDPEPDDHPERNHHPDLAVLVAVQLFLREEERPTMFGDHWIAALAVQLPA